MLHQYPFDSTVKDPYIKQTNQSGALTSQWIDRQTYDGNTF